MKTIRQWIAQYGHLLVAFVAGGTPPLKYRVTPRHNPFAFRRALLREAMIQLKRMPVNPAVSGASEESDWR